MSSQSNITSFTADLMQHLKRGYNCCQFSCGELIPCDYHRNRAESLIYGIFDADSNGMRPLHNGVHHVPPVLTGHTKHLFKTLAEGGNLAGGWYLVQEQREWLYGRLVEIFRRTHGECRILVSGVAGYAHFYSYLKIVFDAAKSAEMDCSRLRIDVADTCITPLLEIAAIESAVRSRASSLFLKWRIRRNLPAFRIPLPAANLAFIENLIPDINDCKISLIHCDIESLTGHRMELGCSYDVVTEHFLISMLENVGESIERSRASYARLLKPHGHLLMACGFNTAEFLKGLLDLHEKKGFRTDKDKIYKVWDPFGISPSELQSILHGSATDSLIALENCLIDFERSRDPE